MSVVVACFAAWVMGWCVLLHSCMMHVTFFAFAFAFASVSPVYLVQGFVDVFPAPGTSGLDKNLMPYTDTRS